MKILAVVACRGGSQGVKNKNLRLLDGKPLIVYTVEQVLRWGKFDKFIVSTDSQQIAEIAKKYGASVPFLRPDALATPTIAKMDSLRHALLTCEEYYKTKFDALFDFDATAPIRTVEDMDNILKLFIEKNPDCVFSVVKSKKNPYLNMVEKQADASVKVSKIPAQAIVTRQNAPEVFDMNASLYIFKRDFLIDENNKLPYAGKTYAYEMDETSGIDINSELDFKFIEFLMQEKVVKL